MHCLWEDGNWTSEERLLVLAFFRGYTFYRDLSEEEPSFWRSFYEELGLSLKNTNPIKRQYDELWEAFLVHSDTKRKKITSIRPSGTVEREFVKTIDAVWGIRSLHSKQLIDFFVAYYRRKPGKSVTADVMRPILRDIGENPDDHLHQLASYKRVFASMTRAVNVILTYELEEFADSRERLKAELVQRDVYLGNSPNALDYFMNKSPTAIKQIVTKLRRQRTPKQFKKYLRKLPKNKQIKTPMGSTRRADSLATSNLPYGWYEEHTANKRYEHEVTPDARISLRVLDDSKLDTFDDFGGIILYISKKPFQARVGSQTVSSEQFYTRSRKVRHFWIGTLPRGLFVEITTDRGKRTYPIIKEIARPKPSRPFRPREDILIQLDEGYFAHDETIVIPVSDVPIGATLTIGQRVFTKKANTKEFYIDRLEQGKYKGIFTLNNAIIGKLAPFHVLPPLTWNLAHEAQIFAGRTQNAQVILDNGQTFPFKWIPRQQADGSKPPRVEKQLKLGSMYQLGISLEATCVPAVFVDPETQALLDVVRSLDDQSVHIKTDSPLWKKQKRLYLASNPERAVALKEFALLHANATDTLVLEAFLQEWKTVASIPVRITPVITDMQVRHGVCTAQINGARDMNVALEEVDPHSGHSVHQTVTPDEYGYVRVRLRYPQKLHPLKVRLVVTSQSAPDEVIEAEVDSPPLLEMNLSLRRGFGWSRRKVT